MLSFTSFFARVSCICPLSSYMAVSYDFPRKMYVRIELTASSVMCDEKCISLVTYVIYNERDCIMLLLTT